MKPKEPGLQTDPISHALPLRAGGTFSWRFLAVLSLAGCIATEILFNILPVDHDTLLLYWFYPASLLVFAQLYFNLRFAKHLEIRFLLAFLGWAGVILALNYARVQLVDSYQWVACACTTLFLCFSLPYAFEKSTAKRVMTVLAITTVMAATLLSILSLIAVYATDIAAKVPSIFEGIGIWEGRLSIDLHPNRSAPCLAIAVILVGYLLVQSKKNWQRVIWVICGILCYIPLSLTVSRTAIIGAGIAVGFEVFLALQVALSKKMHAMLRMLICVLAACLMVVVLYKGAGFVCDTSNVYLDSSGYAANNAAATEIATRDLSDADSLNGRTDIWLGVWNGLLENPKILAFGTGPTVAGEVMTPYFPVGSPLGLFHNSLLGTLVAFGVVGLLFAVAFLVFVAISAIKLSFGGLKNAETLAVRMIPAILLFTVAEGMMEDFLFAYGALNIAWIWLMIAAGFVMRIQKREPVVEYQEVKA